MRLLDSDNTVDYLRTAGQLAPNEPAIARELAGGVSNVVLLVERPPPATSFVVKQVREQLRVPDPWFCSIERIWREVATLRVCDAALAGVTPQPSGADTSALPSALRSFTVAVPRVLFVDRENYLYGMSAAPAHEVWKAQLLRGETSVETAAACGTLLGTLHARTWNRPDLTAELADRSFFDALRLDPYYRHVARQQPTLAPALDALINSLLDHPRCLVHGDFSPKNILVHGRALTLVDFEVGHYGDPAFDLGFFLSHLLLKSLRAESEWWSYVLLTFTFWRAYERELVATCGAEEWSGLVSRGIANCAGCVLARVAGKSRVDYLNPPQQMRAARFAENLLLRPATTWPEVAARFWEGAMRV